MSTEKWRHVGRKKDIALTGGNRERRGGLIMFFPVDFGDLFPDSHIHNRRPYPTTVECSQKRQKRCSASSVSP